MLIGFIKLTKNNYPSLQMGEKKYFTAWIYDRFTKFEFQSNRNNVHERLL